VINMEKGCVIWLTGLPGSGKTTIAREAAKRIRDTGRNVEILDGDEVRKWLSPEAGFSREDRRRHLRRVAHVARLLAKNGVIVLCSFVSPYEDVRKEVREIVESENIRFVEVYTKCSLEECIRRDPKGLYKKALKGEIAMFTGISDIYEEPQNPELIIDTEKETLDESVEKIVGYLRGNEIIRDTLDL